MVQKWKVELFLNEFKKCWPPKCFVANRDKNNQCLADLMLTPKLREEIVLTLTSQDYVAGPLPDEDKPNDEVWIFGKNIDEGSEIYIKLKIFTAQNKYFGKCISFHRAESKLSYPFKNDKQEDS